MRNPVIISGDWRSTFVDDILRDFERPDSPVVATEFVGTSISTNGDRRDDVRCHVNRQQWRTDLRMLTTVNRRDAPAYTYASFVVEDGRPGAHRL